MSQPQPPYDPASADPASRDAYAATQYPAAPVYQTPYAQQYPLVQQPGAPVYAQPQYIQPAYVVQRPTNGLAIAAFIAVWFFSVVGIVLGHVALSQIKRSGEGGHGLALAAVIIGYCVVGLVGVFLLVYFIVIIGLLGTFAVAAGSAGNY